MRNACFAVFSVGITNYSSWVTLRRKKNCDEGCRQWGPRPPWLAEAGSVYFHPGTTGPGEGRGLARKRKRGCRAGALSELRVPTPNLPPCVHRREILVNRVPACPATEPAAWAFPHESGTGLLTFRKRRFLFVILGIRVVYLHLFSVREPPFFP